MHNTIRRKAFTIPEELAEWITLYAFRSRGKVTQSQIATEALERFRYENPMPEVSDK